MPLHNEKLKSQMSLPQLSIMTVNGQLFVLGQGFSIPVYDRKEGREVIEEIKKATAPRESK